MDRRIPNADASLLRVEDVQTYLVGHKWKRDPSASTSSASVYRFPGQPDAEAVVPVSTGLADYAERMADLVQMIAALEERNSWQIFADLLSPPADIVRFQVTSPTTTMGAIPLENAIKLIDGARSLLLSAACSVCQTASYFPRMAYRDAVEFLGQCQLGQTERGSFVAKIVAPVPPEIRAKTSLFGDELTMNTEPFARRSTVQLMQALGHINEALETGDYQNILAGVHLGVSANLCDAVASMQPDGDQSNLQISVNWSSSRPKIPQFVHSAVRLSHSAFDIIRESGRQLREQELQHPIIIEGRVVGLKSDTTLFDGFEGNVSLKAELSGESVRVQVALGLEDYKKACDAHRDGVAIKVAGVIVRDGRSYRLLHPKDFVVLPPQAP